MHLARDQNSDVEPVRDIDSSSGDLPPAYDTLSLYHPVNHSANPYTNTSAFPGPLAGSSSDPPDPDSARLKPSVSNIDRSLPPRPPSLDDTSSFPRKASPVLAQRPRPRNNTSWLSLLPFVSSFSAKRVRQSVLSIVRDLVVPPSRGSNEEQKNVHEMLTSLAETCAEHKLSLSDILQEAFIADHTPVYWAIVNYREELLVGLLIHSRALSIQTVSDIRRACLVNSNQALFHALRVCRPPFHRTDGIRIPSLRAASDNLLLGNRPLDEIQIQQTSDQAFVVSFDIPLWQRRMKAIGRVGIEFIASGRMWSITFFSTDPASPAAASGKSRKCTNTWHVMVSLLESSLPTFFDSQLVVAVPLPLVPELVQTPRLREARSTTFPPSHDKQYQSRSSMYDDNYNGKAYLRSSPSRNVIRSSETDGHSSSLTSKLLPPTHPLRGSPSSPRSSTATPPPISIRLRSGDRKLGCRTGIGESPKTPTTKPDTWSHQGVGYTNAAVSPLGEGPASQLLNDHSRYLLPDGTLRGRLEVRLVKSESSKDCIIC
ncbi:hypothetical protein HD554DRAFT_2146988 [Boletus coccyginus]|nr:hypothetical protein HD554DRAFT_2146988 [Boletus coccyginus]